MSHTSVAVVGAYCLVSAVTFLVYAHDKHAARAGKRRTSEATLHLLSLLGGWPGAFLAQSLLRHKTRKQPFRTVYWGTVLANLGFIALTLTFGAFSR